MNATMSRNECLNIQRLVYSKTKQLINAETKFSPFDAELHFRRFLSRYVAGHWCNHIEKPKPVQNGLAFKSQLHKRDNPTLK